MTFLRNASIVFALVAVVACGTRRDPDFCCSSSASCAASGADVGITRCSDPAAPVCDDDATLGAARPRTCVPDIGGECAAPGDCTTAERPYCENSRCVQCLPGDGDGVCTGATPTCSDTYLCVGCAVATDCVGEAGGAVCDTDTGACVECNAAVDCTGADRPVCEDHACRGCQVDAECASEVCVRDSGACSPVDRTLYVEAGAGATDCSATAPCGTIGRAVTVAGTIPHTIKVGPGTYPEALTITGAMVDLTIHGAGSVATIIDVPVSQDGVVISGGARVTIERVRITRSMLSANKGVTCMNASLTLRQSEITRHGFGGVDVSACEVVLTNDVIARNGGSGAPVGALRIQDLQAGQARRVEFVTVANNLRDAGSLAGVMCFNNSGVVQVRSSILASNVGDTEASPDCQVVDSVVTDPAPGATNIDVTPQFVGGDDFHLVSGSPGVGTAQPTGLAYDLDGASRPQGDPLPDPGADEVP